MRASETDVGRAWLENFVAVERPTATMLLDSLRFASLSTLSSGLQSPMHELMTSGAVRAAGMGCARAGAFGLSYAEGFGDPPTAFDDFFQGGR